MTTPLSQNKHMKKIDGKLKRIEDEVVGMTMEIVGTVLGVNMMPIQWSDEQMKRFSNGVFDIRERSLQKIRKIYLRKINKLREEKE
jgi:hypothetical protein